MSSVQKTAIALASILPFMLGGDLMGQGVGESIVKKSAAAFHDPAALGPPQEAEGGQKTSWAVLIGLPLGMGAVWYILCDSDSEEYEEEEYEEESDGDPCVEEATTFAVICFVAFLAIAAGKDPADVLPRASLFIQASPIPQAIDIGFRIPIRKDP